MTEMTTTNQRALTQPKDWFEKLTGVTESSPDAVREHIRIEDGVMHSAANGEKFHPGTLEVPTLAELRERVRALGPGKGSLKVRQQVADVQSLHADPDNEGALFQVASQFNLLEMTGPSRTPEDGIGGYQFDRTQGPACAIACGAGTIYRNYFAEVEGGLGQTTDRQIDCLRDLGQALGNTDGSLWKMRNGYALPTPDGLQRVNDRLRSASQDEIDALRGLLRVGLQSQTQVTLDGCLHRVSQAYCSAMPVSYSGLHATLWEPLARLVLEAAYEATLCAAVINAHETGCNRVFLTSLGGGAFGNRTLWIAEAMQRAINLLSSHDIEVVHVTFGQINPAIKFG